MLDFPGEFFSALVPFLRGDGGVAQLTEQLGASSSGSARLNFYRTLMSRNVRQILALLYPTVQKLAEAQAPELFLHLVVHYDREHPATSREPNQFGPEFPDFLRAHSVRYELAPYFEEVADYEWCRYAAGFVRTFAEPFGFEELPPAGPDEPRFVVRQYEYNVLELTRRARASQSLIPALPSATVVVIHQDPVSGHARSFQPTALQLSLLAQASGLGSPALVLTESTQARASAREDLFLRGLLSQSSTRI
jgi:hypothetical protein